jgi:hypothetical protein
MAELTSLLDICSDESKQTYLAQAREVYENIKTKIGKDEDGFYYESMGNRPSGWIKESICMGILDYIFGDEKEAKNLFEKIDHSGLRKEGFLTQNIQTGILDTADNALICLLRGQFNEMFARDQFYGLSKNIPTCKLKPKDTSISKKKKYNIYSDECNYFKDGIKGTLAVAFCAYNFAQHTSEELFAEELFQGVKACFNTNNDDLFCDSQYIFVNALYGALACVLGHKDEALKMLGIINDKFVKEDNLYISKRGIKYTDDNSMMGIFLALIGGAKLTNPSLGGMISD